LGYSTFLFDAFDPAGKPIYHTNVLLSLGTSWAVLCSQALAEYDRERLLQSLRDTGREVVEVGFDQLRRFACNILEVRSSSGDPLIAMSAAALAIFEPSQRRQLERFATLVGVPVPTIEAVGGGSVRCMIADIHLPRAVAGGATPAP
jgi:hypothetical protein